MESMDKIAGEDEQVKERGERLAAWFFSHLFRTINLLEFSRFG